MIQGAKLKIDRARRRVSRRIRRIKMARRPASASEAGGIRPENVIWIFGAARTGSTWLGAMMSDLGGHAWWHEPMVGHLFGHLYQERAGRRRDDEHFILGGEKDLWLGPVRSFVLDSANARFPEVAEKKGYLVVKEPHGAQGAALLAEALPESRMVFLIRDPRDVVASRIDLAAKGSVTRDAMMKRGQEKKNTSADERPDAFVKTQAKRYLQHIRLVKEAYDAHKGPKSLVRYEDLRADPLGEMKRLYSSLSIPIDEWDLARVVEKHRWEKVPDKKKGAGKFHRKATPGGWTEDLTPDQIRAVEGITAPLLEVFYAERSPLVPE